MSLRYFATMEELEAYYYGGMWERERLIKKTDDPVLTTTAGVYQPIYGRKVWQQLNLSFNTFAMLPKEPWNTSGWRVETARPAENGGGVAENAAIPDTIKPAFVSLTTKPKVIVHTFDVSDLEEELSRRNLDQAAIGMAYLRERMGIHHREMMNVMLLTQNGTPAGNNIESIDRVCGSYAELSNCKENDQSTSYSTNDLDIYGQDRDGGASWTDATVLHNSSVNRDLTLDLIDQLFENAWKAGANPKVIITGFDTLRAIQGLLQAQQRFVETARVVPTFGGVKGIEGIQAGFVVATYNGVPIIPDKNAVVDAGGISRIYLLDTDYIKLRVLSPTQYFEAGMNTGDPFGINRLGNEGMYRTQLELICYNFKYQGKIRDLK